MVRAVLQSTKGGLSLSRLQAEYKELTGEAIPHKQLGHTTLDALLHTLPSVVRLDRGRSGEVSCHRCEHLSCQNSSTDYLFRGKDSCLDLTGY